MMPAITPMMATSRHRAARTPSSTAASGRPTPTQPTCSFPDNTRDATRSSPSTTATLDTE